MEEHLGPLIGEALTCELWAHHLFPSVIIIVIFILRDKATDTSPISKRFFLISK